MRESKPADRHDRVRNSMQTETERKKLQRETEK